MAMHVVSEAALGCRLQTARAKAGLTQQALCQQAGLSYSTLTKIERGAIKSPSIFTIQSITGALGIGLDELLGTTPPKTAKKRSKSGVTFVYFDVNGCLVRFFHRAFTQLADATDAPADVIETTFWHYNDQVCRGEMSLEEFNQAYAKELGVPKLAWQDYYLDSIEPTPGMQALLEWTAHNYRVGLLSNTMPGLIAAMQAKRQLPGVTYDTIIDSSKVNAIKPEAKIFQTAAEQANCPPNEILLIDDSRANLMAAEKQGWHVLWFDEYQPDAAIKRIQAALEPATD